MRNQHFLTAILVVLLSCFSLAACQSNPPVSDWEIVETEGAPTARHEAAFVAHKNKLYLIGGRRINPVDVYDPATNSWTAKSKTPIEIHHFQAVSLDDKIYIMDAMTGGWPNETPLEHVLIYHPEEDRFEIGPEIPQDRRRGGAGVVVHDGAIYMVGGITNGHMNGTVNWFDKFNPEAGEWTVLPDTPHRRDHFAASAAGGKLYAFGGRLTEHAVGNDFGPTLRVGDVFDFETGAWETPLSDLSIPTTRAGTFAFTHGDEVIIGGGESENQVPAHDEVEAFHTVTRQWRSWPNLVQGRHGSGFAVIDGYLYTASGCGNRGGEPELTSLERLKLPKGRAKSKAGVSAELPKKLVGQWETLTLTFEGPDLSETSTPNPFTDYRLMVEFRQGDSVKIIRGFYMGQENTAETSTESGPVWAVRFTPDRIGDWSWRARLATGDMIAIDRDWQAGAEIELSKSSGSFMVGPSNAPMPSFRHNRRGKVVTQDGYFRFADSGDHWLKGGANSPENLLGYVGFDGTYRIEPAIREGESRAGDEIHSFVPHLQDYRPDDPDWKGGQGRAIFGAVNYLADQGMNAVYFLTLNILGDGKDVWPYIDPDTFDRFDVSKLEQWNILFDHMQARGILLHIVTQETENELMLDGGDTDQMRSLYYAELIARFGHHPGLVWNLGEENGPVHWRPEGQTDAQRMAMAQFFADHDPYGHPVLLHTHSEPADKDEILTPLLGFAPLDGLSFQVSDREKVFDETRKWRELAQESGRDWLITMDEIGMWHTGALMDKDDPDHDSLRIHALWGHLLGGGAGVEWYFGARSGANDLTTEDWRTRENLWAQTRYAMDFFNDHVEWWRLQACPDTLTAGLYCATIPDESYVIYYPAGGAELTADLPFLEADYQLYWYDPKSGGELRAANDNWSTQPERTSSKRDQVALIRKR